jgi:hypothetical protein
MMNKSEFAIKAAIASWKEEAGKIEEPYKSLILETWDQVRAKGLCHPPQIGIAGAFARPYLYWNNKNLYIAIDFPRDEEGKLHLFYRDRKANKIWGSSADALSDDLIDMIIAMKGMEEDEV